MHVQKPDHKNMYTVDGPEVRQAQQLRHLLRGQVANRAQV